MIFIISQFSYLVLQKTLNRLALGAYTEQSTYSSADFLHKVVAAFARKGVKVECVQTDNGFEFTNRFSNSKRNLPTLFEATASDLGIRHKLIRPYTLHHNGKVERSHRKDQKRFYETHRFWSCNDFGGQLAAHQSRSNSRPMRPLGWLSPKENSILSPSKIIDKPTLGNFFYWRHLLASNIGNTLRGKELSRQREKIFPVGRR